MVKVDRLLTYCQTVMALGTFHFFLLHFVPIEYVHIVVQQSMSSDMAFQIFREEGLTVNTADQDLQARTSPSLQHILRSSEYYNFL